MKSNPKPKKLTSADRLRKPRQPDLNPYRVNYLFFLGYK